MVSCSIESVSEWMDAGDTDCCHYICVMYSVVLYIWCAHTNGSQPFFVFYFERGYTWAVFPWRLIFVVAIFLKINRINAKKMDWTRFWIEMNWLKLFIWIYFNCVLEFCCFQISVKILRKKHFFFSLVLPNNADNFLFCAIFFFFLIIQWWKRAKYKWNICAKCLWYANQRLCNILN